MEVTLLDVSPDRLGLDLANSGGQNRGEGDCGDEIHILLKKCLGATMKSSRVMGMIWSMAFENYESKRAWSLEHSCTIAAERILAVERGKIPKRNENLAALGHWNR